jgi:hypothetical protein
MRDLKDILAEIERDLRAQGAPEPEIQRLLALPLPALSLELRKRAKALHEEADEMHEYLDQRSMAQSLLGPDARVTQNLSKTKGR